MSSMAIPLPDSSDTNVWRSSRGVQFSPIPAFRQIARSERRTLPEHEPGHDQGAHSGALGHIQGQLDLVLGQEGRLARPLAWL